MTDVTWIQCIAARDEGAMKRLMDKYIRLLWTVAEQALGSAGSEEDLEECVADVFVCLWLNPEKFDPQRGSLKSYLCMMARSRALNRLRQLNRQTALPLETLPLSEEPEAAELLESRQDATALHAAIDTLEEPDREILVRRYYYDQKPKEIAVALNLPVKQIENRLYRAKRRLRDQLTLY